MLEEVKHLVYRSARLSRRMDRLLRACLNFGQGREYVLGLGYKPIELDRYNNRFHRLGRKTVGFYFLEKRLKVEAYVLGRRSRDLQSEGKAVYKEYLAVAACWEKVDCDFRSFARNFYYGAATLLKKELRSLGMDVLKEGVDLVALGRIGELFRRSGEGAPSRRVVGSHGPEREGAKYWVDLYGVEQKLRLFKAHTGNGPSVEGEWPRKDLGGISDLLGCDSGEYCAKRLVSSRSCVSRPLREGVEGGDWGRWCR